MRSNEFSIFCRRRYSRKPRRPSSQWKGFLWKSIPIVSPNILFLGDYVDRGKWGLECAIYIMCLKLLAPKQSRLIERQSWGCETYRNTTLYRKECVGKYGDEYGPQVFEMTNRGVRQIACQCSNRRSDILRSRRYTLFYATHPRYKWNQFGFERPGKRSGYCLGNSLVRSYRVLNSSQRTAELLQVKVDTCRGFLTNTKRGTAFSVRWGRGQ